MSVAADGILNIGWGTCRRGRAGRGGVPAPG